MEDVESAFFNLVTPKEKRPRGTFWLGLLGGLTLFAGSLLLLWDHLSLFSLSMRVLLCAIPYVGMSVWVWMTHTKSLSFFVNELISALWVGAWWLSMCLIAHLFAFQMDATYCLGMMLSTFLMMVVRPSHLVLGGVTILMPVIQASASAGMRYEGGYFIAILFMMCAMVPLIFCWRQWRLWAHKDGIVACFFHWIYAVAIACYCAFYLTCFLQGSGAFAFLMGQTVRWNLTYLSLVTPLLLGAFEERNKPIYRRPLMILGSLGMGGLLLMMAALVIAHEALFETVLEAITKTCLMTLVVGVSVPKTFAREGLFLPFIPMILIAFSVPYVAFIVPLIAGGMMIVVSLRQNDRWTANLALCYGLGSLLVSLLAAASESRSLLGGLLILCGALFLGLNAFYNHVLKRGER